MASIRKRLGKYQVQIRTQGQYITKTFIHLSDAKKWSMFHESKILLGIELQLSLIHISEPTRPY